MPCTHVTNAAASGSPALFIRPSNQKPMKMRTSCLDRCLGTAVSGWKCSTVVILLYSEPNQVCTTINIEHQHQQQSGRSCLVIAKLCCC